MEPMFSFETQAAGLTAAQIWPWLTDIELSNQWSEARIAAVKKVNDRVDSGTPIRTQSFMQRLIYLNS
jgi:hypothetical protein